jgi:hypothetical protein
MIAQMALMDVTQKSFSALTKKLVFDQLGMMYSTFEQPLPKAFVQKASWAYSSAAWFKGMPYVYPQQAAAGLYSTPSDLAKFFIDIQKSYLGSGKMLKSSTAKLMLTPQYLVSDGTYKEQMGIGPFIIQRTDNQQANGVYFEFTGVNAGFLAYGIAGITNGNGVVIMLNSGDDVNGLGKELRRSVAKVYNWPEFLPNEINPMILPNSVLNKYVGRYRMSIDEVLYLRKEKNYLVENINDGNDIYCFPIGKDSIVFSDYNIKGAFKRDDNGQIIGLQNIYQQSPMLKMSDTTFSPSEYLSQKNYPKAKKAFADMKLNEYQISYIAYNLLNKKSLDFMGVKTILDVAIEQHPKSSIVYSRLGDYYLKINDKASAIKSLTRAVELDPNDLQVKELLDSLK